MLCFRRENCKRYQRNRDRNYSLFSPCKIKSPYNTKFWRSGSSLIASTVSDGDTVPCTVWIATDVVDVTLWIEYYILDLEERMKHIAKKIFIYLKDRFNERLFSAKNSAAFCCSCVESKSILTSAPFGSYSDPFPQLFKILLCRAENILNDSSARQHVAGYQARKSGV